MSDINNKSLHNQSYGPPNEHSLRLNLGEVDFDGQEIQIEKVRTSTIDSSSSDSKATMPSTGVSTTKSNKQFLKYISLVTLTIQNASLTLFMRAAKTQKEPFISSTAVIMAEFLKLITCFFMVYRDEGKCFKKMWNVIERIVIKEPLDTLKVAVPAIVYYIQNNLTYLAATHLDPATNQVTYQLKILTTALFSVFLLKKKLVLFQWFSLILLFIGVVCVQLTQRGKEPPKTESKHEQNFIIGFLAILTACVLSGFSGVYLEKILKNTTHISLWIRNIQLSAIAIPFGLCQLLITDFDFVQEKGFFHGYTIITWTAIILNAQGGLLVAVVVKYADNILKGFATSISIIISCIVSIYVFDFVITYLFLFGATVVISSVFLYNKPDLFTNSKTCQTLMKLLKRFT